jgi:hypothetical protein
VLCERRAKPRGRFKTLALLANLIPRDRHSRLPDRQETSKAANFAGIFTGD